MNATATPPKILVLLKHSDTDHDFECPDCNAYVARLKGCEVADLTDPETYALAAVMKQKENDFLGIKLGHHGRLGEDYCRRKFFFWDINQARVKIISEVCYATQD